MVKNAIETYIYNIIIHYLINMQKVENNINNLLYMHNFVLYDIFMTS